MVKEIKSSLLTEELNKKLNEFIQLFSGKQNLQTAELLFEFFRTIKPIDTKLTVRLNIEILRKFYATVFANNSIDLHTRNKAYQMYRKTLYFAASEDLDSFLLYMEIDRPSKDRFWEPRRSSRMMEVCKGLQQLADGSLDILIVELPPRTGKTTLSLWAIAWICGKSVEKSTLLVGHTAQLVKSFYNEILSFISDSEKYKYFEIFPNLAGSVKTMAKDLFIDMCDMTGRKNREEKRFTTFACKSIQSPMAGVVEAKRLLYLDDLMEDIQEALSESRLETKRQKLFTDVMQRRATSRVPILQIVRERSQLLIKNKERKYVVFKKRNV